MRIIDFFDGSETSTVPTLGNISATELETYANDAAYEAANTGAPTSGNMYYNSTTNTVRYYDVGSASWKTVLSSSSSIDAANIADGSVSNTEFQYLNGATSSIQTQINTLDTDLSADILQVANDLVDHEINDLVAHPAVRVSNSPSGNLAATDVQAALNELQSDIDSRILSSEKGAASGVAPLNASSKIESIYLPSYVDDVEEYANLAAFPVTGETGKIYTAIDTGKTYRWTGSIYTEISPSDVNSVNGLTGIINLDTDDIPEGTALYFTDERAQDAVGSALTDSSSVDFTYTDGSNQITAVVLPAGVDHDQLNNFVANEHVDHSAVNITTAANSGLSGGGDITATRSLLVDPNNATSVTAASGDLVLIADVSDSNAVKKVTAQSIADLAAGSAVQIAYLKDVKTSGTSAGTFTSGAYQTRTLNTVEGDGSIVSLSSNQFTLQAGTYHIEVNAPCFAVNQNKAKLRNITDSTDAIIGIASNSASGTSVQTNSVITGTITIASAKTFEVQHRCTTTRATDGFGINSGFGESEVYTIVKITMV